jgi:hypothetical protein
MLCQRIGYRLYLVLSTAASSSLFWCFHWVPLLQAVISSPNKVPGSDTDWECVPGSELLCAWTKRPAPAEFSSGGDPHWPHLPSLALGNLNFTVFKCLELLPHTLQLASITSSFHDPGFGSVARTSDITRNGKRELRVAHHAFNSFVKPTRPPQGSMEEAKQTPSHHDSAALSRTTPSRMTQPSDQMTSPLFGKPPCRAAGHHLRTSFWRPEGAPRLHGGLAGGWEGALATRCLCGWA